MRLNPFKKKRPATVRPVVIPRRKTTFQPKLRKERRIQINVPKVRGYLIGGFSLVLIILLLLGAYTLITSKTFAISGITYLGNSKATTTDLDNLLSGIKGRNIFLVRSDEITDKLLHSKFFLEAVTVKKIWPDKLKINITESQPEFTLINMNGGYLITKNGKVIEVVAQDKLNFSDEELDIIKGFGSPNAHYVEDRMRLDLGLGPKVTPTQAPFRIGSTPAPTPTPDTFDFFAVDPAKKIEVLNIIRAELLSKVGSTWDKYSQLVSTKEFSSLPRIFAYDNSTFKENDTINLSRLEVTNEVVSFFNKHPDMIVQKIIWESDFLVDFELTSGQSIIFGVNRKASEQLEDFEVITQNLTQQGKTFARIDLSSKKVSVILN
jgi:cell division septal protein FtsQ